MRLTGIIKAVNSKALGSSIVVQLQMTTRMTKMERG